MDPRTPELVVVGSFVVGMTVRLPRVPALGETLPADLFDLAVGGKGSNLAVAAARQGSRAAVVVAVGQDQFALLAVKLYQEEGIDSAHLLRKPGATAVGLVYLYPDGENTIGLYLGANDLLTPADVRNAEKTIAACSLVATQFETPDDTVAEALHLARHYGKPTVLNPAPARTLSSEVLRLVDYLTPNLGEARLLLGLGGTQEVAPEVLAAGLLDLGARHVVITLGREGCLYAGPAGVQRVPATVMDSVDSVGAGDAFNGGLCAALIRGLPVLEAVQRANVTAGLSTRAVGPVAALPDFDTVSAQVSRLPRQPRE